MMQNSPSSPKVMGIININQDSYFSPSRASSNDEIRARFELLVSEGADIIDIGACSTRPGSNPIEMEEEWRALEPALEIFKEHFSHIPLSVDTFHSEIVRRCHKLVGDFIVNDISAGEDDDKMLQCVAKLGLNYIAMHKRGTPKTMQGLCQYEDVTKDIIKYFKDFELRAQYFGIKHWIVDPGFGFAKTLEQNYEILDRLEEFSELGKELLIGISRKSFIYKKLGLGPEDVLEATSELHISALKKGASILRVHDVAAAKQCIKSIEHANSSI